MLLRASGEQAGLAVDLGTAVDPEAEGDAGVPHGRELLAFASAANRHSELLPQARADLEQVVGAGGVLEAAATVAIFNGLVRVADGTGIQLDPAMLTSTTQDRSDLGIDGFAGAANSVGAPTEPRRQADGVLGLFS